ncbi:hypothetical protein DA718_19315 [Klebsiella huaxiensis]|nr:hypothetical protein DA718_19315 [Klebsiella huaxiensis]
MHFPGARELKCGAKNNRKSSYSLPINRKKNSINFFSRCFAPFSDFGRVAQVMGCRQLSTIPVDNLVH